MKVLLTLLFIACATAAEAHVSLVPHQHPHGASALPDITSIAIALLLLAVTILALAKGRKP